MPVSYTIIPKIYCWSKSIIYCQFVHTSVTIGDYLEVQVTLTDIGKTVFLKYPFRAANGTINVYLNKIIDAYSSYKPLPNSYDTVQIVSLFPKFSLSYRIVTASGSGSFYSSVGTSYAIKGGISDAIVRKEELINRNASGGFLPLSTMLNEWWKFPTNFATWTPSGCFANTNEDKWLLYMHWPTYSGASATHTVTYKFYTISGTVVTRTRSFTVPAGYNELMFLWIPVGIDQMKAALIVSGAIAKLEIVVNNGQWGVNTYTIHTDTNKDYEGATLYYRTSGGGLDSVRLKGNFERSATNSKQDFLLDKSFSALGTNRVFGSETKLKFKGNTGYLTKLKLTSLLEMLQSEEHYIYLDKERYFVDAKVDFESDRYFTPVKLITKDFTYRDTKNNLFNENIEFEIAHDYTVLPQQLLRL